MDVQSVETNAFSQDDINILSALTDQVSVAIQNARQFEETRKALRESEALSRQFVQTRWQNFTKSQKLTGILHTGAKTSLLYRKKHRQWKRPIKQPGNSRLEKEAHDCPSH